MNDVLYKVKVVSRFQEILRIQKKRLRQNKISCKIYIKRVNHFQQINYTSD